MLATATHDTKRGEDARARLNVLSEVPQEWRRVPLGPPQRRPPDEVDGEPAPDRNEEYFFYQTLIGAWPAKPGETAPAELVQRVSETMTKALKEAKAHTSWINPNEAYDARRDRSSLERTLTGPRVRAGSCQDFVPRFSTHRSHGHDQLARAGGDQDHRSRRARLLPGAKGLLGPQPGGPGQPAGRSITPSRRGMLRCMEPLLDGQDRPAGAVAELLNTGRTAGSSCI